MASYPIPTQYPNNQTDRVFNISDFKSYSGSATLADLLNYANLYESNLFTSTNYFTSLNFSNFINGISPTILNYVNNLSTYYFDTATNDVAIGSNVAISGSLAISTINTNSILSQDLVSNNITCTNLTCTNLSSNNNLVSFLFMNSIPYPIIKSGLISNLTSFLSVSLYLTLSPKTTFILLDSNNIVLYSLKNTSSDYIYYSTVSYNTFLTPYSFQLFINSN